MTIVREMPALPANMAHLPVDKRGYVVPWFVSWINGEPEFRIADTKKMRRAVLEHLCWVCGRGIRAAVNVFVIGPMCAINRVSSEPPSHPECARFSALACPFLTMPKMRRREDEVTASATYGIGGVGIRRNPGVALLWFTRGYKIYREPEEAGGGHLFHLDSPTATEWYCEGRQATRAEVMHSIETGLPLLREVAQMQNGGTARLEWEIARTYRLLPKQSGQERTKTDTQE
jgi:hypothetical protein